MGQLLAVADIKLGVVNSSGLLDLLAAGLQLLQGDLGVLLLNLLLLRLILDSVDLLLQTQFLLRFGLAFLVFLRVVALLSLLLRDLAVTLNIDVILLTALTESKLVRVLEVGLTI